MIIAVLCAMLALVCVGGVLLIFQKEDAKPNAKNETVDTREDSDKDNSKKEDETGLTDGGQEKQDGDNSSDWDELVSDNEEGTNKNQSKKDSNNQSNSDKNENKPDNGKEDSGEVGNGNQDNNPPDDGNNTNDENKPDDGNDKPDGGLDVGNDDSKTEWGPWQ